MSRLSIITINLNNKAGLEKTIQSVLAQTGADYEYIIIDGASTDGSKELIDRYQSHLSFWVSEKDSGIYEAMNKGIKKAKGEYLLFLNSGDDLYTTEVVKNMQPYFEQGNDVISGALSLKLETGPHLVQAEKEITLSYFRRISLFHQATFIKRSLFDRFGLYDESFRIGGDYEFFIRTLLRNQVSYQPAEHIICNYDLKGLSNDVRYMQLNQMEREKAWSSNFNPVVLNELDALYEIRDSKFFWIIKKTKKKGFFYYFFSAITSFFMVGYRLMTKLNSKK